MPQSRLKSNNQWRRKPNLPRFSTVAMIRRRADNEGEAGVVMSYAPSTSTDRELLAPSERQDSWTVNTLKNKNKEKETNETPIISLADLFISYDRAA